jgi:hypothetical protein
MPQTDSRTLPKRLILPAAQRFYVAQGKWDLLGMPGPKAPAVQLADSDGCGSDLI